MVKNQVAEITQDSDVTEVEKDRRTFDEETLKRKYEKTIAAGQALR